MFYSEFISKLQQSPDISGLLIFTGVSPKTKIDTLKKIEDFFSQKNISFETMVFSLDEKKIDASAVISHIETLPFFCKKKITVIKMSNTGHSAFLQTVGEYYSSAGWPEYGVVIIDTDKNPQAKAFEKFFLSSARFCVEFELKKETEVNRWVCERFKELGVSVDTSAADIFTDRFGFNIETIASEITKVKNTYPERSRLSVDEIAPILSAGDTAAFFQVIDDIIFRKKQGILKIEQKIRYDEEQYEIFSYLRKCIRYILQARTAMKYNPDTFSRTKRNISEWMRNPGYAAGSRISSDLKAVKPVTDKYFSSRSESNVFKTHPFQMQKFFCAAGYYGFEEIQAIHAFSVDVDRRHKAGNIDVKSAVAVLCAAMVEKDSALKLK